MFRNRFFVSEFYTEKDAKANDDKKMRDEGTNFLCEIEPHKIEIVAHITKKVRTVFWFSLIPIHSKNESH